MVRNCALRGRFSCTIAPCEPEATIGASGAIGLAVRDRTSGRIIAYTVGSALENHDEQGVREDPHEGDSNTFYMQATATHPTVKKLAEVETWLLALV